MLKKLFAMTGVLTLFAAAAYAGPDCCASKAATTNTASAETGSGEKKSGETKSCCAAKATQADAQKAAAACCAKEAKTASIKKGAGKKVAAKSAKAAKVKLTDVRVCPMMGEAVSGKGGGNQVVGAYNVHFCCAGCKPAFNKLPKAEQQKKIQEALKKQNAAKAA